MADKPLERLEQFAIDVILERRYGKRAALLRFFLLGLSRVYEGLMRLRWWLYCQRLFRWHSTGCLIISIGNLTVGGTGKTPIVEQFARSLTRSGRKVAILSRGYKSSSVPFWKKIWNRWILRQPPAPPRLVSDGKALLMDSDKSGDEPFMLACNLHDVAVLVDKNRVKSALYAIERFGTDTLLLDDGYQYLPFKERLNVLLIDRQAPFGNRHILPRGTLREPKDHLSRGDVIFLTKCDGSDLTELKQEIRMYNKHAPFYECAHVPIHLQDLYTGERMPLDYLKDRNVGAISGIAVPESFEEGLKKLGAKLIYGRHYADHHRFSEDEVVNAINRTIARGGTALLTTEKDSVRFPRVERRNLPVYFLRVEIRLLDPNQSFDRIVRELAGI
ncbi:MAG: tetraacyldisaccharide 4'-kinase [Candidatus Methylacidiphilales bacterium]|nr:tetraacyldisaccharide 4'-kinase [Candidatus Methylacidiphilales bacterium]